MNPYALAGAARVDQASNFDTAPRRWQALAGPALRASATFWFGAAVLGQLLFAFYVAIFYGRAAAQGRPQDWNKVLHAVYVPGDTAGNLVLDSHLVFAVAVTVGGALQLMPYIRRTWPRFHRWNGRVYLLGVSVASTSGLITIWTRKAGGDLSQHVAISLNALPILAFAGLVLRHAMARQFDVHRRWALRLFLAVSGEAAHQIGRRANVVFVTAYADYAVEAFAQCVLDYLVKPVETARLAETVARLKDRLQAARPALNTEALLQQLATQLQRGAAPAPLRWIRAQVGQTLRLIPVEEIDYLRSDTKYTLIAWRGDAGQPGEALVRIALKELVAQLDPEQFAQVHRSVVVNLRAVSHVTRGDNETADIHLRGRKEVLPVSRSYLHVFRQM